MTNTFENNFTYDAPISQKATKDLIKRRRSQMLVHSFIYYRLNDNIISDSVWQEWANELRDLQNNNPDCCNIDFYDEEFDGWSGDSGNFLPLGEPWIGAVAERLLEYHSNRSPK